MLASVSKITDLPFVRSKEELWAPERRGNYNEDCAMGRFYAREMMAYITRSNSPDIYGHIAEAIQNGGRWEGVEIGFCSEIGIFICVAST